VIDSDRLVHEELREPAVIQAVRQWWGESVISADGGVDRRALADIVFHEPDQLRRWEGFLYPRIARRREGLASSYEADSAVRAIVIDAPKLYEAGVDRICDAVIFVDADRSVRLQRLAAARQWTPAELIRRESAQIPLDEKRAKADYVVENSSSFEVLRKAVEQVWASILASFSDKRVQAAPQSKR
jgi:dephospho-CoA kinase